MNFYLKDPGSRVDYAIDWGHAYLTDQVLVASGWTVVPSEAEGLTIAASSFGLTRAAVTLSGGVSGHAYSVTNRVTLSDGQIDERSITLRVEER